MKRSLLLAVVAGTIIGASIGHAWAKDPATSIAVPKSSPLYGKIGCASDLLSSAPVTVRAHLTMTQTIPAPSFLDPAMAVVPPKTITVFDADLSTTDRSLVSVSTVRKITYVSRVERKDHQDPVLTLSSVPDGVEVNLWPVDMSQDHQRVNLHLKIYSDKVLSIKTVTDDGLNIEVPDSLNDRLDQTVSVRIGESVDLKTPNGTAHLTLLSVTPLETR